MKVGNVATRARREALATLEALGEPLDRNRAALDRYVSAVDTAARARAAWEADGCPLTTMTLHGTIVKHPLVQVMLDAETEAGRRGRALGLDPSGRATLGRRRVAGKLGDRTPDRTAPARPGVVLRAVNDA